MKQDGKTIEGSTNLKVKRAIISVSNKKGLIEFAEKLKALGVEMLSTGGTQRFLSNAGIPVKSISQYTEFPEILNGRVKTLHPKVHGGILARRGNKDHMKSVEDAGIELVDMVVVNLYPFEETIAKGCTLEEAVEEIDIGGPSMIRAAAKNFKDVAVITDPVDYKTIGKELEERNGELSLNTRFLLAKKVFSTTAMYDYAICRYLNSLFKEAEESAFNERVLFGFKKIQDLRYGENPHQKAAFYKDDRVKRPSVSNALKLQGKELSFNNILDLDSAWRLASEFKDPCVVVLKHNNPCGVAISDLSLKDACIKALACDSVSAFGGIIASNRMIDGESAEEMTKIFLEAIMAPQFDDDARAVFAKKKNLRLMQTPLFSDIKGYSVAEYDIRKVSGGALVQTRDDVIVDENQLKLVTQTRPQDREIEDMLFAWKVCKHVKSNAIVYAKDGRTLGIGAGQMSRVDSARIAALKAQDAGLDLKGSVMASDAFFPFRDSIDTAAKAGIKAVIQPGGSIRDEEVIKAANEYGMAMVFTGIRHFRH